MGTETTTSSTSVDVYPTKKMVGFDNIGYVMLVDVMGNDKAITDAARVSYGSGTSTVNTEKGLIRFLMRKRHTSPFEMAEMKFEMCMPFFVARQWMRHRTANINEISGRYSILTEEYYVPPEHLIRGQSETNRQASGAKLPDETVIDYREKLRDSSVEAFTKYEEFLDVGVARETARLALPLNTYTRFVWKCDLHNILHLLKLRDDCHAQSEIQAYAKAVGFFVNMYFPLTYEAWQDYVQNALTLSVDDIHVINLLMQMEWTDQDDKNVKEVATEYTSMTPSEIRECIEKLRRLFV